MRNFIFLSLAFGILFSCAESKSTTENTTLEGEKYVELRFAEGPLKGVHRFAKVKGKLLGGVGVHYNDKNEKNPLIQHTFGFSANGLASDAQLKLSYLTITAKGGVTKGNHQTVQFNSSNTFDYCVSLALEGTHERMGTFDLLTEKSSCTDLKIEALGPWEEKTIHQTQRVKGLFETEIMPLFRDGQGNDIERVQTTLNVSFLADHKILKEKNKS